jgi:hypothetical protein
VSPRALSDLPDCHRKWAVCRLLGSGGVLCGGRGDSSMSMMSASYTAAATSSAGDPTGGFAVVPGAGLRGEVATDSITATSVRDSLGAAPTASSIAVGIACGTST